jgi:hypothetical protein
VRRIAPMLRCDMVHVPHVPPVGIVRRLSGENRTRSSQDCKHGDGDDEGLRHTTLLWLVRSAVSGVNEAFAVAAHWFD